MPNLTQEHINELRVLIDQQMTKMEKAIGNNQHTAFTVINLSRFAEIDAILRDMTFQSN